MSNVYEWFVPDTLTITDPTRQGPTIVPAEDGQTNVIIGTHWALKGTAPDGTVVIMNSYTAFKSKIDPATFKKFDQVNEADLKQWLWSDPDGSGMLSKQDQQNQMDDKLTAAVRAKQEVTSKPLNHDAPASEVQAQE